MKFHGGWVELYHNWLSSGSGGTNFLCAGGVVILKKYLEKISSLPLSLISLEIAGVFSFVLLVLTIVGGISIPGLSTVKTDLKQIISSENLRWVIIYSFFFVFLGEILLVMGYIKGKSLIILSLLVI